MKDLDVHKKIAVLIDADNAQLSKLKAKLEINSNAPFVGKPVKNYYCRSFSKIPYCFNIAIVKSVF